MSEREVFELNDDGEPPSRPDRPVDAFHISEHWPRVNYETGETYDPSFSEYIAIQALTADAERLIADSGLLYGDASIDSDVSLVKDHTRLRRRTSVWFYHDDENTRIPVTSYAYFYSEILPNGIPYTRSWDDTSRAIHWNADDQIVDSATDIHERMLKQFRQNPDIAKVTFGKKILKHIFHRT